MKTKIFAVSLFSALLIFGVIVGLRSHTEEDPFVTNLMAGQHIDVGDVIVWNDGDYLYVKYLVTAEGWCLTETHLHVAESMEGIPQKKGNPPPGQFTWQMPHECVNEYTYIIPLAWDPDIELYIAAHAKMEKILEEAPYYASAVFDSYQGLTKGDSPVRSERSTPEQALALESGEDESNFFSLGFGGWIIVEFDCPIRNGEGNDVIVWEDTWGGGYPLETASVQASQEGTTWTLLGTATNLGAGNQRPSEFDLGDLEWAKYIKIVDTTDPEPHAGNADGFDLNAVGALQHCIQEETAWGAGLDFPGKNWATYFIYTVQSPYYTERYPEEGNVYIGYEDWINGDFDYNDFGMTFSVEELYKRIGADDYLCEITMTFTAVIYDSGMDHLIHIRRPINGSFSYTVTRPTTPAYPNLLTLWDLTTGKETPADMYTDPGTLGYLDAVLFNTYKYDWPQKQINETVIVHVILDNPNFNPKPEEGDLETLLRSYSTNSTTFYDLDPIMANYDPWEEGTLYQCRFHISDTQVIANIISQRHTPDIIPIGTKVPLILVVPYTDWIPPFEDTTITGPYRSFDDFYIYGTYDNWYDPSMVINNLLGYGGLSWGPYPIP